MPVNPELIGRVFPPTSPYLVGREKVREFARATFADDPQHAVIRGAGACVDDFGSLERVLAGPGRR